MDEATRITRKLSFLDRYQGRPAFGIIDALSTMVVDGTSVKILAWYDNEIGYVHRMVELARKVAVSPRTA